LLLLLLFGVPKAHASCSVTKVLGMYVVQCVLNLLLNGFL